MNLTDYAKYGIALRTSVNEGTEYYMVTLTFGKKWAVQMPDESTEQKVMCAKIREDGTYCYMTEIQNGLEPVFKLIDATITYNEELEKKVELLKVKAEELKELFANKGYEELLHLKFVIETHQEPLAQKNKRPTNPKKKTSQKANTKPTEAKQDIPLESDSGEQVPSVCESKGSEIDRMIAAAVANKK